MANMQSVDRKIGRTEPLSAAREDGIVAYIVRLAVLETKGSQ